MLHLLFEFNPLKSFLCAVCLLVFSLHADRLRGNDDANAARQPIKLADLTVEPERESHGKDWLLDRHGWTAGLYRGSHPGEIVLSNGLVRRTFRLEPNAATVALDNVATGKSILRAVQPEAEVTLNGKNYAVGGLIGQPNLAYLLPEWLDTMKSDDSAFQFAGCSVGRPSAPFPWKRVRHHAPDVQWPPAGVYLRLDFNPPTTSDLAGKVRVSVHYELYDGMPLTCKWITVENLSDKPLLLDRFTSEKLSVVEHSNWVETREGVAVPRPDDLHVESDFAFGGFEYENANRHIVHWRTDDKYETQVNYLKQQPSLLVVEPTRGPAQDIAPGTAFTSCRAYELVHDSTDRERRGLAVRRMYRTVAPWVTENPLMHHMLIAKPDRVREAIDQAADVGFEMIILSFGSGFDMENTDTNYLQTWREVAEYAKSKGVEIGGYSLLSSRRIGDGNDIVSPPRESPTHGNCPALTSAWGQAYFKKLYNFYETSGFTLLEHDGSYPGDVDVTPRPPLQKGEADSQWAQWQVIRDFYQWCRENGVYINVPDYYFLAGANKCGMGYREVNWSLPRAMQVIHTRQNIFDGTWNKTPSMGWMFVPLSQYHGGGAAATIEPLHEHLDHYRAMMECNLGLGVQACYRGPRLFDTAATRTMVSDQVVWFKKYRHILESDIVHGRRADGRDLDWMLHVNPTLDECGMLLVYNPLQQEVKRTIRVNLYYTGLADTATVSRSDRDPQQYKLKRDFTIELPVSVGPEGMSWYVIRK